MDIWSIAVVLCIAVVALEITWVLRRGAKEHRGYLALLLVDAALLGYTLTEPRFAAEGGGPWPELIAGVALCIVLVFVPRLLDRLIRNALATRRVSLAARLAGVKELLQPGRSSTVERETLADLAAARAGNIEEVVRALRTRLVDAEPDEEPPLHERIITTLAFAGRWREAVMHFEKHVGASEPASHPALAIQMVQAYGETDEFEKAGQIVHRMEMAAQAGDPMAVAAVMQVRLVFLATVGGRQAIERMLALPELASLSPRMRALLNSVAASRRDDRQRNPPSEEVLHFARAVAERVAAEAQTPAEPALPRPRASMILVALNVVAFGALTLFLLRGANFSNGIDLVRAGASFHPAVKNGEWWRLWTAMFLHGGESWWGGPIHLGLNMYGLYLLGRIVEPLFGWKRFVIIYCVSGLLGNLASVWNPNPEAVLSIGASGAVMGIMGALLVALRFRRSGGAEEWRRAVLVNLLVLTGIQLAFGGVVRVIDNYAHVGGLVGGAALAWLLLPEGVLSGRKGTALVWIALAAIVATAGISLARVIVNRPEVTLAALPRHEERVDGLRLNVPPQVHRERPSSEEWPGEVVLIDPITGLFTAPHIVTVDGKGLPEALRLCVMRDRVAIEKSARDGHESPPPIAAAKPFEQPGWTSAAQDEGGSQPKKMLYYARAIDAARAVMIEVTSDGNAPLRPAAEQEITRLLASVKVDDSAPAPAPAMTGVTARSNAGAK